MATINASATGGVITVTAVSTNTGASTNQENFDIARNQGSGVSLQSAVANASSCANGVQVFGARGGGALTYRFRRSFFAFDTSAITGTVSGATLKLDISSGTRHIIIVKANKPDTTTNIAITDFDDIPGYTDDATMSGNVTDYSAEVTSFNTSGTYTEITLNSTANTDIQNLDAFVVGIIEHDSDYSDVLVTSSPGLTTVVGTGGTNVPQIAFTEASGYTHKVLGVASGNIAAVDGVLTANISKVNGV